LLLKRPFWFLRHGETDWNRENRTQGSTDIPLNDTGLRQARDAAALLVNRDIARIIASPLQRAVATADIVSAVLDVPVILCPDLREANFGLHEGEVMGAWFAAWVDGAVAPEGGESFAAVQARAIAAVNSVLADGGTPLLIGHGGFFRTVRAAMGFPASVRTPNGVPLFCAPDGEAWEMRQS